jgi:dipeptidyl aminopeptidase/acylaminoacyl peptidase
VLAAAATRGQGRGVSTDIVVRDLVEDTDFRAFVSTDANEVAPRFSPDGRWLAYASDESGVFQVFARRFPGPGERVQVSDAGGGQPVWSPDGRRLFYQTEDAVVAALLEIDRGGERLSVAGRERLFRSVSYGGASSASASYDVNPDGTGFALTRAAGGRSTEIVLWMDWLDELRPLLAEAGR